MRNKDWPFQFDDQGNDVNEDNAEIDKVLNAVRNERPDRETVRSVIVEGAVVDEETRDLQSVVAVSISAECPSGRGGGKRGYKNAITKATVNPNTGNFPTLPSDLRSLTQRTNIKAKATKKMKLITSSPTSR